MRIFSKKEPRQLISRPSFATDDMINFLKEIERQEQLTFISVERQFEQEFPGLSPVDRKMVIYWWSGNKNDYLEE